MRLIASLIICGEHGSMVANVTLPCQFMMRGLRIHRMRNLRVEVTAAMMPLNEDSHVWLTCSAWDGQSVGAVEHGGPHTHRPKQQRLGIKGMIVMGVRAVSQNAEAVNRRVKPNTARHRQQE